jgi:protein-disulfide isomerase
MTSGKKARQRRTPAPPPVRSTGGRKASPKVLAVAAGVIAVAAVGAALAFALTGGSSGGGSTSSETGAVSTLPDAGTAVQVFRGIPQHGTTLGSLKAPVTMVEYIDLQCPVCRAFETEVMPTIVRRYVRTGKVQVVARPIAIIGTDSETGRRAALAAAKQNRFFELTQLLYYNQGGENSGWLDDSIVRSAFASLPGLKAQRALAARNSSTVTAETQRIDAEANADQVGGTPTVLVGKRGGKLAEVTPGYAPNAAQLSAAIDSALRS